MPEDLNIVPMAHQAYAPSRKAAARRSAAAARPDRGAGLVLFVSMAQLLMTSDTAVVSEILPAIARSLATGPATLTWVASAFALAYAGLLMVGGRLADLFGQRRCCLAGLALLAGGALLAAASPGAPLLIAARILEGVGAAVLAPANFSLLNTAIPAGPARHRALGVFGAVQGLALIVGFVAGGGLTTLVGWRAALLIPVPFAIATAALGARVIPRGTSRLAPRRIDALGGACIVAATCLLVWGFSTAGQAGWLSSGTLIGLAGGVGGFLLLILIESRVREPLLDLSIFRRGDVLGANLGILFTMAASGGFFLLPNLYMQQVLHFSAAKAGLGMAPQALASMAAGRLVTAGMGRLSMRQGALAATGVFLLGLLLFLRLSGRGDYVFGLLPALLVGACGSLCATVLLAATATGGAPPVQQGVASALAFTTQQVGMALGMSVSLAVVGSASAAGSLVAAVREGFGVSAGLAALALGSALLIGRSGGRARRGAAEQFEAGETA